MAEFTFEGRDYTLPLGMPPHAIHGAAMHRGWGRVDAATIATELGPDWPFAGRVVAALRARGTAFRGSHGAPGR